VTADTEILPTRYRSVRPIASGGMGEIFLATDELLGRQVAVKVLSERYAQDADLRARFTREALAAARLSGDSNTVTIYDVGEWNGRPYIVMEHVPSGTVAERMTHGGVDSGQALNWLEQAALALDHAHEHGVVHRDVKPANLLVGADGRLRVADFGIASAAGLTSVTVTGTILGTLGYLAPEQAAGGATGPATDRYALAVVAYELLAGRRPYESGNGHVEAAAAARGAVPPISEEGVGLPRALDPVFRRALAPDPEKRYPTCAAFVADLRAAFDDGAGTTPAAAAGSARRFPRLLAALLVLAALAAAGVAAALLTSGGGDGGGTRSTAARTAPLKPRRVTVTAQGETVTVTTSAPAPAPPSTPTTAPTTSAETQPATTPTSGTELNDHGFALLQQGDYQGALPYFEQAVPLLQGTGSLAEAYSDYNLALTRFTLGSCDGVADLLDRSEAVQGSRKEITSLRKQVTKKCG
jgi:tRNA A-37 threonylcarbamoyl transferase component Bud32/cell division septation protein DedD